MYPLKVSELYLKGSRQSYLNKAKSPSSEENVRKPIQYNFFNIQHYHLLVWDAIPLRIHSLQQQRTRGG